MSVDPAVAAAANTYLSLPMNFGEPTNLILIAERDAWVAAVEWLVGHPEEYARLSRPAPPADEWEYGAGYEAHNGVELRWFAMDGAFTVREAAERDVERYSDSQIRLVRRRPAGPWEEVTP
jgi:hypothetical protein